MKRFLPVLLIIVGGIGLAITVYLVITQDDFDIRDEAASARTVKVCSSGCDFSDINSAFVNSYNNDTIFIDMASYDGMGVLTSSLPSTVKNLTIKGRGIDQTVWKLSNNPGNGHQLHIESISGVTVTIKDMTFNENDFANSSIHIYGNTTNCTFNFESVKVVNSKAAGIYYEGDSIGTVNNSYFANNEWPGVSIHENASVTIKNSKFENHQHQGVDVRDSVSVTVDSCEFIGNNKSKTHGDLEYSGVITLSNSSISIITNNSFEENELDIITIYDNSNFILKENNMIGMGNNGYGSIAIFDNAIGKIEANSINTRNNVSFSSIELKNNSSVEITNNIILPLTTGINIRNTSKAEIINNSIIGTQAPENVFSSGIEVEDNSQIKAVNNIIVNFMGGNGIYVNANHVDDYTIKYNDIWNNKNNYVGLEPGEGDISIDPKFVSSTDFHLQPTSPAINAGDPDTAYNDPDDSRNDMGAYGGTGACGLDPNLEGCSQPECTSDDDCKRDCVEKKRQGYACQNSKCAYTNSYNCDKTCGAECINDNDCSVSETCNTQTCTCSEVPPDARCNASDIYGPQQSPDNIVNIYDLSYILGKWKSDNAKADIWGQQQGPDGIVNIYDISKVLGCWKKSV
jgi:hypothetical protein